MTAANHPAQKMARHLLSGIEASRKARGISQVALATLAGVSLRTYSRLIREEAVPRSPVLARLRRALDSDRPAAYDRAALVRATFAGFLTQTAEHYRVTVEQVRAIPFGDKRTGDAHVLACSRARAAAIYLVNTSLEIRQAELAGIFGVSRAAICLALQSVETRRDDPAFDAFIARAQARITGES